MTSTPNSRSTSSSCRHRPGAARMPLSPDPKLENVLRDMADLPTLTPEERAVRIHEDEAQQLIDDQMQQAHLDAAKLRAAGGAPPQGPDQPGQPGAPRAVPD